jgi:hypothetical protein
MPMTPRMPKAITGATSALVPRARWWETQPMSRMYPAETSPMSGPASSAQVITDQVNR